MSCKKLDTCEINQNCLAILKYDDLKSQSKLISEYVEIELFFSNEVTNYMNMFNNQEFFNLNDIRRIKDYFINNIQLNKLNMEYRYCKKLDGRYEGFSVDIKKNILKLESFIDLVENKIDLDNLKDIDEKIFNELKNDFYNLLIFLIDESIYADDTEFSMYLEKDILNINEFLLKIYSYIIESYKYKIKLWADAYSIQKAYRLCHDKKDILFFSHRINGWASPVCQLHKELSAEYKTNFGYGHSSYFYIKLKFKTIELIPFSDLIRYRNAGFFEINQYTQKYNLSNNEWASALSFLVKAYNILIEDKKKFIQIYMIDEIKRLLKGLAELMENDHFTFDDDKNYITKYDEETGEVINQDMNPIEIIILRAKKITNSLDFISKIQEYQNMVEIDTAINKIENFNTNMKYILENEIIKVNQNLQNFNKAIQDLKPRYFDLQQMYNTFKEKENLIKKNNNFPSDKCHEVFLEENPDFLSFMENYEPLKERFIQLNNKYNSTKHILKELQNYNNQIINYFKNK